MARIFLISFFALALMLNNKQVFAAQAQTTGGHVACLSEEWLDDIISFLTSGDRSSFQAYIDSQKCVITKSGLRVTVTDYGFMTSEIVFQGVKLYIPTEGIKTR